MSETVEFDFYDWGEFKGFLDSLPDKEASKLMAVIDKIEDYGLETAKRQKWVKKLDTNLYEIRSKFSSNIQRAIYFQLVGTQYVITHGFTKKSQKTPIEEITKGKNRRAQYIKGRK